MAVSFSLWPEKTEFWNRLRKERKCCFTEKKRWWQSVKDFRVYRRWFWGWIPKDLSIWFHCLQCDRFLQAGDGSNGTGGIEQYYNDSLIGVNGREYGYLDEDANLEGVVKSAVNGRTVVSTIDVNVQKYPSEIHWWMADQCGKPCNRQPLPWTLITVRSWEWQPAIHLT